jgi:hypothetical protein
MLIVMKTLYPKPPGDEQQPRKKKRRAIEAEGKAPPVRMDRRGRRRADGGSLLHAAGPSPQRAVAEVAGLPADLYDMADRGGRWLMTHGAEALGPLRPDEGEAMRQEASARGDPPQRSRQIERWLTPSGGGGDDSDRHRGGRVNRRSR